MLCHNTTTCSIVTVKRLLRLQQSREFRACPVVLRRKQKQGNTSETKACLDGEDILETSLVKYFT